MDFKAMAKAAGLTENDLKGKNLDQQIKLITAAMENQKDLLEIESAKEYIENFQKKIPKLKDLLVAPIEIYVKKVAQKKTPTSVKVIGFNSETSELIVYYGSKLNSIPNGDIITSMEEFENSKIKKSPKKPKAKKEKEK